MSEQDAPVIEQGHEEIAEGWLRDTEDHSLCFILAPRETSDAFARLVEQSNRKINVAWIADGVDPMTLGDQALKLMTHSHPKAVHLHPHPAMVSDENGAANYDGVSVVIGRSFNRYTVSAANFAARGEMWVRHLLLNCAHYRGSLDVAAFADGMGDPPVCVVVGGGASLHDESLMRELKVARDRRAATVIATDRALPVLLDARVMPDAVCTIDQKADKATMLQHKLPGVPLVVSPFTNPALVKAWPGMRAFHGADGGIFSDVIPPIAQMSPGETLSVGNLAVKLAMFMKPAAVCLIGMEFSGSGDGKGSVRPRNDGDGTIEIGIGYEAMVEGLEHELHQHPHVPVWNYSRPDGVGILGTSKPVCALADLLPREYVMLTRPLRYDAGAHKARIERLRDNPEEMDGVLLFGHDFRGEEITDEARSKAREFVRRICNRVLPKL